MDGTASSWKILSLLSSVSRCESGVSALEMRMQAAMPRKALWMKAKFAEEMPEKVRSEADFLVASILRAPRP